MSMQPFYRIGQPVLVPVSPTSAGTPFPLAGLLPDVPDLTFMFVNPNDFDCRLEGTPVNADGSTPTLVPVTATTGWSILARSVMGPLTSKRPMFLSVAAYGTNGAPLDPSVDYSSCVLELIYGTGT